MAEITSTIPAVPLLVKQHETFLEIFNSMYKKCKVKFEESTHIAVSSAIKEEVPMLLYLYKKNDSFSESVCSLLGNENINDLFNNFRIFVWDIQDMQRNHLFLIENEMLNHENRLKNCLLTEKSSMFIYHTLSGSPTLKNCYDSFTNEDDLLLEIYNSHIEHEERKVINLELSEKHAVISAVSEIDNDLFQCETLKNAIKSVLNNDPIYKQKILVLYFHNKSDNFWLTLQSYLNNLGMEEKYALDNLFYFLPWNVKDKKYHEDLKKVLSKQFEYSVMQTRIDNSEASLYFFISCKDDDPCLFNTVNGNVRVEDLRVIFNEITETFVATHGITIMDEFKSCSSSSTHFAINKIIKPIDVVISEYALCFPIESRKMILFHSYKDTDKFSKSLLEALRFNSRLKKLVRKCCFFSWNVGNPDVNVDSLVLSVKRNFAIQSMENLIQKRLSGLYLFMPIGQSITLVSYMDGKSSISNVCSLLEDKLEFFDKEIEIECNLPQNSEEKFGPTYYQQMMSDRLSNRDYDCIKIDDKVEKEALKKKIAFAFYGPPSKDDGTGYEKKQWEKVEITYEKLVPNATKYNQYENEVVYSTIFNCLTPMPEIKLEKSIKSQSQLAEPNHEPYSPNLDFNAMPVFVIRKCVDCPKDSSPCRIFIDQDLRVYESWDDYLDDNKHPKGICIVPQGGRYQGDAMGNVTLQYHLSPACGWGPIVLKGADIGSAVIGVGAGIVGAAVMIPAIPVAPVVAVGAMVAGVGVGIYSMVRSAITVHDRITHQESMSLANSEARGAYFNIVAGTLGFTGSGATFALSYMARNGVNIGLITRGAVNGLTGVNILVSGAAVTNSTYEVYRQWLETKEAPSMLTIVQLSSSILFFGHAVYNVRSASTVISEAQAQSLQEINGSLRSNRHRKMFDKLTKEQIRTTGNAQQAHAEVISYMKNLNNQDEVFATLTRVNKALNKNDVRFSLNDREIVFNGVKVDLNALSNFNKMQQNEYFATLPEMLKPNAPQTRSIKTNIQTIFSSPTASTYVVHMCKMLLQSHSASDMVTNVLNIFSDFVQRKLLVMLERVLQHIELNVNLRSSLMSIFPKEVDITVGTLSVIIDFCKQHAKESTVIKSLEFAIILLTRSFQSTMQELIRYVTKWIASQLYSTYLNDEHDRPLASTKTQKSCEKCRGVYYC